MRSSAPAPWKRRANRAPEQVRRAGEADEHCLLDLDVAGEDDERLARFEEVVDPRQRRVELAARGEALERRELREPLGAQDGRDLRIELGELQGLRAQPLDERLLRHAVLALVRQRDGDDDPALGRQLRQDLVLARKQHTQAPQA